MLLCITIIKTLEENKNKIPTFELLHENEEVAFAIRFAEDMIAFQKDHPVLDVPHRHNYYTVLWSHNQSGKHRVDYQEFEMQSDDIYFISPGMVHQVIHTPDASATVILFTCDFLDQNAIGENFIQDLNLFSEISFTPPIKIDKETATQLKGIVGQMQEAFDNDAQFRNEMIGAYLKLFLIACNKFAHPPVTDNIQAMQSGKIILKNFKDKLEQHFTEWKKVGDYAAALNLSPDYLNEAVKATIGKTAKEIIQQRIILEAKRLGLHTDMTTKEIAYRIGFDDPSHFSKFFKNCEGSSFSEFRKALDFELRG